MDYDHEINRARFVELVHDHVGDYLNEEFNRFQPRQENIEIVYLNTRYEHKAIAHAIYRGIPLRFTVIEDSYGVHTFVKRRNGKYAKNGQDWEQKYRPYNRQKLIFPF